MLGDKAYDSRAVRRELLKRRIMPVISRKGADEFVRRYEAELAEPEAAEALAALGARVRDGGQLTLVTAAKDPDVSHTSVLKRLLES